jgi:hypothetical protein
MHFELTPASLVTAEQLEAAAGHCRWGLIS